MYFPVFDAIGKEYVNEEHLIQCIDYVMSKEYQGVKGEYVKYKKPVQQTELIGDIF